MHWGRAELSDGSRGGGPEGGWSAHKAVAGALLKPGASLLTDWPLRLTRGGDYRVVISAIDRGARRTSASPTLWFHVRRKPVLQAGRVLPVAVGAPPVDCEFNVIHYMQKFGQPF